MKKLILLFAFALAASAQITKVSTTTVTATAGPITCVFSSQTPEAPTGVSATCALSGTNQLTMTTVIPLGATNGIVGSYNPAGGAVTWIFTQASAASGIAYSISATPSGGPPATGSGTF